jgi:hypothetical protein
MDFIERFLAVSPDGGSGTLELLVILIPIFVLLILVFARFLCRLLDHMAVGPSTAILPHEMGHACNLWHVDPSNLMAPSDPRAINSDWWRIALLRVSCHVTYF